MPAPTSCNLGWVFEQLAMGDTHLRIAACDSHWPAESTITYRNGFRRNFPLPMVAERCPMTFAAGNPWNVSYSGSSYGNTLVDPGDDMLSASQWHGAGRCEDLLWTENQTNGSQIIRSKLLNSEGTAYFNGDWYTKFHLAGKSLYYHDDADCIQKFQTRANRGSTLGTATAIDATGAATNLYATPTSLCPVPNSTDDTEVGNIVASSAGAPIDETGKHFIYCGSIGWRHTGTHAALGDVIPGCHLEGPTAIPGWQTNHHAATSGDPDALYYTDTLLARDLLLGATSFNRTLVWFNMLGGTDGGNSIASQRANWNTIVARHWTAGAAAGFTKQRQIFILPHYSTSATADLQRQQMDILYDLARNDERIAYYSVADATGWSLFDGNGGRPDWLEASTIHFDSLNGPDFVMRKFAQDCAQAYRDLHRRVRRSFATTR